MEKPRWWSIFHPQLNLPLIGIAFTLMLIALGYLFGVYQMLVVERNLGAALVAVFSTLLYAVPAYGILRMKRWARFFEIVLSLLLVGLGMFMLFAGIVSADKASMTQGIISIVVHGLIAVYLLTDHCRSAFGYIIKEKQPPAAVAQKDTEMNTEMNKSEQAD